jgi:hypothetical protein
MVVVVVVAEKEVPFVETAMPFQVALEEHPRAPIHRFTAVDPSLETRISDLAMVPSPIKSVVTP